GVPSSEWPPGEGETGIGTPSGQSASRPLTPPESGVVLVAATTPAGSTARTRPSAQPTSACHPPSMLPETRGGVVAGDGSVTGYPGSDAPLGPTAQSFPPTVSPAPRYSVTANTIPSAPVVAGSAATSRSGRRSRCAKSSVSTPARPLPSKRTAKIAAESRTAARAA